MGKKPGIGGHTAIVPPGFRIRCISVNSLSIGIIGAGNMGEALIRGILRAGAADKAGVYVSDKRKERLDSVAAGYGVSACSSNAQVIRKSEAVVLCVKPQDISSVLDEVKHEAPEGLLISIAAGITTRFIEERLGGEPRVVRVMPIDWGVIIS